jgi:hypothetical protein
MDWIDMKLEAAEHLRIVGPKRQILEAIDGLIESACDGIMLQLGHGCSCDPIVTHDYAAECLRQALDQLFPSEEGRDDAE